ncbi:two-component sensor histidine kinase [Paenibacillus ihbetae]|uniref:histidine kinase n=1 Tax=Paenibacillus ihbetae TaxID=1870820 RepID=A0A1B2E1D6_9BACL|nr:sensor histidine kinase [Paenibacillus ihbetae]ANY73707.1 two-component sensor histidine kinase [Paenibacillus ihbetae]
MKKILSFMDWGIFALRLYHYILLLSQALAVSELSIRTLLNVIWLGAALGVPLLFWFPGRRMNKVWFCILELLLGGSYYVHSVIDPDLTSKADYLLPSLTMGYLLTKQTLWIIPVVVFIPFSFQSHLRLSWEQPLSIGADNLLFCFIGMWASLVANAYDQKNKLVAEVEHQNKLLTHYSAEIEKMTLLEERNRMSKELHDTLGHSFISLILSLDASIALMDSKPAEAKDRLIRLRALAEKNLDDMRNIVHEMGGEEESSLIRQVESLAARFREHTGTALTLSLPGTERSIRFEVRQTILRVIQESFTNAIKHGKASQLDLELKFSESHLQLSVRNNGKPIDKLNYGFGLTTMKHRVERLGGSLHLSSGKGTPAVTEVRCEIPLKGVMPLGEN